MSKTLYFSSFICGTTIDGEIKQVDGQLAVDFLYDGNGVNLNGQTFELVSPLIVFETAELEDEWCSTQAGAYRFRNDAMMTEIEEVNAGFERDLAIARGEAFHGYDSFLS